MKRSSAAWMILIAATWSEQANADVPEDVLHRYFRVKSKYGDSSVTKVTNNILFGARGARLRLCESDGRKYYEIVGNAFFEVETWIFDYDGKELFWQHASDTSNDARNGTEIDLARAKCEIIFGNQLHPAAASTGVITGGEQSDLSEDKLKRREKE